MCCQSDDGSRGRQRVVVLWCSLRRELESHGARCLERGLAVYLGAHMPMRLRTRDRSKFSCWSLFAEGSLDITDTSAGGRQTAGRWYSACSAVAPTSFGPLCEPVAALPFDFSFATGPDELPSRAAAGNLSG